MTTRKETVLTPTSTRLCLHQGTLKMETRPVARRSVVAWTLSVCCACLLMARSNAFLFGSTTTKRASPMRFAVPPDSGIGDVTSTLARLDQNWQLQQRLKKQSRWTKLVLKKEQENDEDTTDTKEKEEFVYLLEPDSISSPSCVILFLGGAGLGQFPQVAYSEFLQRLSSRLNAAVLTAPYAVGLDHFTLAKQSGELLRKALVQCEEDGTLKNNIPNYCVAHSLGAKLQTIYMAATGQEYDGVGFISFNNFGFAQTISMARSFAKQLKDNVSGESTAADFVSEDVLKTVFDFAESVVGAIGVEFSPNPVDTDRIIELKYNAKKNTRLFVFDDDTLDSSRSVYDLLNQNGDGPSVSALPGQHLTPVYFKLGLEDLPEELPREMAAEAIGGVESASFGNEEELNALVDEVCGWIMGKDPSREPSWGEKETWQGQRRITGGREDTADVA